MTTFSLKYDENGNRTSIGTSCEVEVRDAENVIFVTQTGERIKVTESEDGFLVEYNRPRGFNTPRTQTLRFRNGNIERIEKV